MVALTIASHLLFFIVTVISVSLVDDADRNINDPFALYAYGEDISGLRVFAADGIAVMGDITKLHGASTADFNVTARGDLTLPGLWEVYAISGSGTAFTKPGSPAESSVWLSLNNTGGPAKPVGFTTVAKAPDMLTDIWWLYGYYVEFDVIPGKFHAHQIADGLWQLMWSQVDLPPLEYPIITVRSLAPVDD